MKILKFNESFNKERIIPKYTKLNTDMFNIYILKGYKLYYYKDFELIEITNIEKEVKLLTKKVKYSEWEEWGDMIFFLDKNEYDQTLDIITKSKEKYNKLIKDIEEIKNEPLEAIYYDIIK